METDNFENVAKQIVETVKVSNKETGNCFTETTKVIKLLFPNGIPSGKEQEAAALLRIIDKMFKIVNNPGSNTLKDWQGLSAYALNAVKSSV